MTLEEYRFLKEMQSPTADSSTPAFDEFLSGDDGTFKEKVLDVRDEMRKIVAARAGRFEQAQKCVTASALPAARRLVCRSVGLLVVTPFATDSMRACVCRGKKTELGLPPDMYHEVSSSRLSPRPASDITLL
jgi:hypothetical protein